jgi:hypothetical protein
MGWIRKYMKKYSGLLIKPLTIYLTPKKALSWKDEKVKIKNSVISEFGMMINKLRERERHSIQDIVNFMSKKELAEMAHALVELTSKKRRFSTDQETVGGPIDVAIVTRNEGFIWIRRKHYFDRAVNPGYYARVFVKEKGGENDSQTSGENDSRTT